MSDLRPDPDALLERIAQESARRGRGMLKIFFGYAAGVGKTYAMLRAAHRARASGRDVVIGYVEPHARPETQALVEGLESIPPRRVEYRGVSLLEFDIDAALERKPDLILVDELPHTNAEGSRHIKRLQDVEELLEAGIDVWTTLNVQHIDSLNDLIESVTGVVVRETVPDSVLDRADEIELIDIPPEELLTRLRAGRIYEAGQAERAMASFFRKSNLAAFREFFLKQAARRVQSDVEADRRSRSISTTWATAERMLVCVGPSPSTVRVLRAGKRLAQAFDAPWIAVAVERPGMSIDSTVRSRLAAHYRLAERLGAEVVTLSGEEVVPTLLDFARSRNVTKIVAGKPVRAKLERFFTHSVVDDLIRDSGEIDVYVVQGEGEGAKPAVRPPAKRSSKVPWRSYVEALAVIAVSTLVAVVLDRFGLQESNVVMVFLAGTAIVAARYGRAVSAMASVAAVIIFDFGFVPPRFSFTVNDVLYVVTFGVMLAIALFISAITSRLEAQIASGRIRERRISTLYELGRQLTSISGRAFLAAAAARKLEESIGAAVAVYQMSEERSVEVLFGGGSEIVRHPVSEAAARWAIEHDQLAGSGTDTLPNAVALFLPMIGSQKTVGALAVRLDSPDRWNDPEERRLLEACAGSLASAIERDAMSLAAAEARIDAQAEHVRSSLLGGISHDLRTPLAAIAGASSSILQAHTLDDATRRRLSEMISSEANRLTRLLENILRMSRLEFGGASADLQWNILEEIVGSAIVRSRAELGDRTVHVSIPAEPALIEVDGLLLEQLFVNLFENAARYTPPEARIEVEARVEGRRLSIRIADDGPGLPPGSEERIFEKFHRAHPTVDGSRGSGLGLAICRAIAKVHGGTITARYRAKGGAEFLLVLPLAKDPPRIAHEAGRVEGPERER